MNTNILLNDKEYYFNACDADWLESYSKAEELFLEEIAKEQGEEIANMKHQANAARNFIDSIFGAGANREIIGDADDMHKCLSVYKEMSYLLTDQVNDYAKLTGELFNEPSDE